MPIKEFLLSQIAKLHYGNKFDKNKMTYARPDVNFVSRTAANNGISDVVDQINGVTPYPAGCVSLAFGGSIGSCFLQDKPFYTGQNVGVIEFSPDVPHEAKLYFVTVLEKVCKAKYVTFSDEINKHFKTDLAVSLQVTTVMVPDWAALATLLKCHGGGAEMSKIDTSSWKKFKISELFEIRKVYGKPLSEYTEGKTPYVTGSEGNNGVVGYVSAPPEAISEGGCIAVDPIKGFAMYQPEPFVGRGFSGASINLLYNDNLTEETAMYVCAAIEKVSKSVAAYTNLFNSDRLKNAEISLPVTTKDVPDWDYMQERIAELEQERIAELEQYLVAAGLNDYTLTEDDCQAMVPRSMMPFRMGTLFDKQELKCRLSNMDKRRDTSTVFGGEYVIPLVNAKHGDNGIQYYGRQGEWDVTDKSICIVSNGAIATGDVYPEPQMTGVLWDAYLIKLSKCDTVTDELLMYLSGAIEKAIKLVFDWGNKAVWNKVQHEFVQLPIQTDESGTPVIDEAKAYHPDGYVPDWKYMAAYIRVMEKLVIRDVVDYKDEFIRQHRLAVAGSGV